MSFDRVRGAKSYAVLIALRDGLRTDCVITRASLNVVVPMVGPLAGHVIVRALGDNLMTADGPEAATSIAVPRPQQKRRAQAPQAPQAPSSLSTGPEPREVLCFAFVLLALPVEQRTSLREHQLVW